RMQRRADKEREGVKNDDVEVRQDVVPGSHFQALDAKQVRVNRDGNYLVKTVEPHVVVPEEPHTIRKDLFHPPAAHGEPRVRVVIDVSLGNGEGMLGDRPSTVLIVGNAYVKRFVRMLHVVF